LVVVRISTARSMDQFRLLTVIAKRNMVKFDTNVGGAGNF